MTAHLNFLTRRLWIFRTVLAALTIGALAACGGGSPADSAQSPIAKSMAGRAAVVAPAFCANPSSDYAQVGNACLKSSATLLRKSSPLPARASAAASVLTAEDFMNWVEAQWPILFPGHSTTVTADGFVFRYYAGAANYLAVSTDGLVYVLGAVTSGQLVYVGKLTDFSCSVTPTTCSVARVAKLAVGNGYTLATLADGRVIELGSGMIGGRINGVLPGTVAKVIDGLAGVVAIHTGGSRSFALTRDGSVFGWGDFQPAFGLPNVESREPVVSPVKVAQLGKVVEVAVSGYVTLALTSDGSVWALPGTVADSGVVTAQKVEGLSSVVSLSGSAPSEVIAVDQAGVAWVLRYGTMIRDSLNKRYNTTVSVEKILFAPPNIAQMGCWGVPAEGGYCLAIKTDGTVWSWGSNGDGGLGDGTQIGKTIPVQVKLPSDEKFKKVFAAGSGSTCSLALSMSGRMYAWGGNCGSFTLALGHNYEYLTPGLIPNLFGVEDFSANDHQVAIVLLNGTVWSLGPNDAQFGGGTIGGSNSGMPVQAIGLNLN
jgi:alpha-tubulin suppressor-like RCC1 family protein